MKNCATCKNSVYNKELGERRCKIFNHKVRDPDRYTNCNAYKNKEEKSDERKS